MNRKECSGCIYHKKIQYAGYGSTFGCVYILETGVPRGCPPGPHCKKYARKKRKKTAKPPEPPV